MRIEKLKIYTFEELSEKAKQRAIEGYRQCLNRDFGTESGLITENMEENVIEKTCKTIQGLKLNWSLNSCQGDGVNFIGEIYGYNKNFIKFLEMLYNGEVPKNIKRIANAIVIKFIRISNFYQHEKTVNTEIELTGSYSGNIDRIYKILTELENFIDVWRVDLCKELEEKGYKEIEYFYSYEYITNIIIANNHEFLEDGNHYYY